MSGDDAGWGDSSSSLPSHKPEKNTGSLSAMGGVSVRELHSGARQGMQPYFIPLDCTFSLTLFPV